MKHYDPLVWPDPQQWLALDEEAQIALVEAYHRRARIRLPNARVHAVSHVVVESQVALGDEIPVRRTLQRLISEGLDRHDAVHAIGLTLLCHMSDLLAGPEPTAGKDPNLSYYAELERLTAEEWRRSG